MILSRLRPQRNRGNESFGVHQFMYRNGPSGFFTTFYLGAPLPNALYKTRYCKNYSPTYSVLKCVIMFVGENFVKTIIEKIGTNYGR